MRYLTCLLSLVALGGCASTSHSYVDDRPTIGVQQPKPMCTSGPNGKTAACATVIAENAAFNQAMGR